MNNIKQRQRYYEHLLSIGMPDILAASMAAQTNKPQSRRKTIEDEIWNFAVWFTTVENVDFWGATAKL